MSNLQRWVDAHQFSAVPMQGNRDDKGNILPSVKLLWMTPDPLGAVAAMSKMYLGQPVYDMAEITDQERERFFADACKTHLQAPLESIKFHLLLEGVSRSFTHQLVRQRTAVYSQESLRFAVKENMAEEIALPPSIAALAPHHPTRQVWDEAIQKVSDAYQYLVNNGIPSEDARGLTPHAITTRVHFITDLRNLSAHAGNRLCTQAQYEWRVVFMEIVKAIREFTPDFSWIQDSQTLEDVEVDWNHANRWQFERLANSPLFRPICYQVGHCTAKASFDRSCTIRERVDMLAEGGVPSIRWDGSDGPLNVPNRVQGGTRTIKPIHPAEWLLDPAAARDASGGAGHD